MHFEWGIDVLAPGTRMREQAMKLSLAAVIAAVALWGCAPTRYSYAPVTTTSADLEGASAAVYGMPPEAPRGDVRIAMLGVSSISAIGTQESKSDAIHLALSVSNRSDETWTVDPSEQRVSVTLKRQRSELYATTGDGRSTTVVSVLPRSTKVINLYFPLPIQFRREDAPPPFDVVWTVHAGGRAVTQRTPFQRFVVSPTPQEERDLRRPEDFHDTDRLVPGPEAPEHKPILPTDPLDPLNASPGQ
jgi:hypothetical protein